MKKMKHISLLLATLVCTLGFTACDNNEDTSFSMQDGPLEIRATIAGGADTRATVDGDWTVGDEVALWVQDGNGAEGIYRCQVTDNLRTLISNYYWPNKNVPLNIQAVYPYRAVTESSTNLSKISWSVQKEQNENDGYEKSDFLCSEQRLNVNYGVYTALSFYHQTAKIVVNIKKEGLPTSINAEPGDIALTIGGDNGLALNGTFTPPETISSDGWLGTWTLGNITGRIKPHLATNTVTGCIASYEALVIPQDVEAGTKLLTFTATKNGTPYGPFYYTLDNNITWNSGYVYTYDITIFHYGLEVQVSEGISWENGTGGSGSVELPV